MATGPLPPRLLFVMNSPIVGGAEQHTFQLAESLQARGCPSSIFAMKAGPARAPAGIDLLQPVRPRTLPRRIAELGKIIRDLRPDIVVAINERPVLASFAGRILSGRRVPIVAISHSTILRNRRERLMQLAYTPLFNRIESVVFISRNQRAYWTARGFAPRHDVTILNAVDLQRFSPEVRALHRSPTRERFGLGPDDIVIGLCAVMRPEKNHLQMVEAVASLRAEGVPVKALLVGDGPMRATIE